MAKNLQRDELKVICRKLGLLDGGRVRLELARRLLVAGESGVALAPVFASEPGRCELALGEVVRVRYRQYLVEAVTTPARHRRPGGPSAPHRVFRTGIQLLNYQLVPLERALELPRANLFIADNVGPSKTIGHAHSVRELPSVGDPQDRPWNCPNVGVCAGAILPTSGKKPPLKLRATALRATRKASHGQELS